MEHPTNLTVIYGGIGQSNITICIEKHADKHTTSILTFYYSFWPSFNGQRFMQNLAKTDVDNTSSEYSDELLTE